MQTIKIARLHQNAVIPNRKHADDAGLDIYACQDVIIHPRSHYIVPTGVTIEVPAGYVALLKPKGRNDHLLGAGVVDAGYQGEILVKIFNPTDEPLIVKAGDAIGQLLLIPIITPAVMEVPLEEIHVNQSKRGANGGIVTQHSSED